MPGRREPFRAYDDMDYEDFDDGFEDEDLLKRDEFGCCFPGRCCMPGYHYTSECHTPEMMEELHAEAEAAGAMDAGGWPAPDEEGGSS